MFGTSRKIDPNKVAIYIRWSTDEQGQGTTLEVQEEACQYYCKSQGWTYRPELVYVDDGYSGASLDRPALARLRADVAGGGVGCVVVYKLDRLSRNLVDCVTLVRKEWGEKCALYSTKENFDTESPVGQMVFNILVSFAEFERNVIRDRTQSGKLKRAQQGRNPGQIYPFGYKKGDDGNWALDGWDEEQKCFTGRAAIVRRIFEEYLSGVSARAIADKLRQDGVPASKGGSWRYNTISALLGNSAYAGQFVYGRRRGQKWRTEPLFTVANAIPPIVSQREWDEIQRLRTERAAASPRSLGSDYLLSGLIRCGKCGGTLAGAGRTADPRYRYYTCTNRVFLKSCDCAYIDATKLEARVIEEVKREFAFENIRNQVEQLEAERRQKIEQSAHAVAHAEEVLSATVRKRKRLDQEFYAGNLDGKVFSRMSADLEVEAEAAHLSLEHARNECQKAEATTVDIEQMVELSRRIDAWAELSTEELKQALRDAIGTLTVYQQKVPTRTKKGNPNPIEVAWRPRLNLLLAGGRAVPHPATGEGSTAEQAGLAPARERLG